ncbi:MAG TPA: hypothetical protein PK479_05705, partial [Novosphingobium sp.]|nr:hypothetical protein [Novosphingobium sp.]
LKQATQADIGQKIDAALELIEKDNPDQLKGVLPKQYGRSELEPAKMGERDAVKFNYEYAVEGSPLKRRGTAIGSLSGGLLYLISYTAPATHFYEQNRAKAEAIMASAHY